MSNRAQRTDTERVRERGEEGGKGTREEETDERERGRTRSSSLSHSVVTSNE